MKTKVLFIGDIYRGGQSENIRKAFHLFSPIFRQAKIECDVFVSDINGSTDFSEWRESWHESLLGRGESQLSKMDLGSTAVVGFEVSQRELNYLALHDVPYVNIEIHPLRFLDDLYLNVTTSFDYDLDLLSAGTGLIQLCANSLRIRYGGEQAIPCSTLAILGQTPFDKSAFYDGEFRLLDSYFDQLDKLAGEHRNVIYRPHPYGTDTNLDKEICDRYGAAMSNDRNLYKILASGNVSTVCAISSSAVVEAPYFGVTGKFLEARARQYNLPVSYARLVDDESFWFRGLLGASVGASCHSIGRGVPQNFLRDTFGYWGYVTREKEMESRIAAIEHVEDQLIRILNSKSWKVTSPLRWADNLFAKLFKRAR